MSGCLSAFRTDEEISTVEAAHNSKNRRQLLYSIEKNFLKRWAHERILFLKFMMVSAGISRQDTLDLVEENVKIAADISHYGFLKDVQIS